MRVAMAARNEDKLKHLMEAEPQDNVLAYSCDAANRSSVEALFEAAGREIGSPELVVYNTGAFAPGRPRRCRIYIAGSTALRLLRNSDCCPASGKVECDSRFPATAAIPGSKA